MNVKNFFRYFCLIFIIAICVFIFLMSAAEGPTSSKISGSFIEAIIRFFNKGFDSLTEQQRLEIVGSYQHFVRKAAHFSIYAALGFFSHGFLITFRNIRNYKAMLFSLIFVLMYAASDEIHQLFIPLRSGQISDVILDTLGGILGILILKLFSLLYFKRTEAVIDETEKQQF